eukprot:403825_1
MKDSQKRLQNEKRQRKQDSEKFALEKRKLAAQQKKLEAELETTKRDCERACEDAVKQRTLAMQLFHASGVFQMGQTTKEFQEALVSEVRDDEAVGDLHVEDIVGMRILSCLMAGSFSTREIASKVLLFHDGMAYLESLLAG